MLSPTFFQNQQSGKTLIQTFGRGQLSKYVEPNQSERNAYEQRKINQSIKARTHKKQAQSKVFKTASIRKNTQNKQNEHIEQFKTSSAMLGKKDQFQEIDSISLKINNIIKSISTSCNKKQTASMSKKSNRLQRCQTTSALNRLQNKYHKDFDSKQKIIDQFKQQRNRIPLQDKNQNRQFDQDLSRYKSKKKMSQNNMKVQKETPYKKMSQHVPQYDDINQRIQLINNKISKYQQKMASYQKNKLNLDQAKVCSNKLHNQSDIKKKINTSLKKSRHSSKPNQIDQSKVSKNLNKAKQYTSYQKNRNTVQSGRKTSYYAQKYRQIMKQSKRSNHKDKQNQKPVKINKHLCQQKQSHRQETIKQKTNKVNFIQALIKQIALDQDFRYAKHMFAGMQELFQGKSFSSREKWVKLKNQLNSQGLNFTLQQVTQIFMPRDDEIDPFMSVSHSHQQLVHSVVFAYQTAQQHWNQHLYHNWTYWELKQANFLVEKLDRGKKGFVTLEDLAFYLNTQLDNEYRNRDLMLIFHRLGSKQKDENGTYKLKFKEIMSELISE